MSLWGSLGGAYSAPPDAPPDLLAVFNGPTSKRLEGEGGGEDKGEGKGGKGR